MTPLEELQAAHKRLSELRHNSIHGPWRAGWGWGAAWTPPSADLIVTLHRTIDAQLATLNRTGGLLAAAEYLPTGASRDSVVRSIESALDLARAINGEAS